jgi:TonB family protein
VKVKTLILLFLWCWATCSAYSQTDTVAYLDIDFNETTKEKAAFYRVTQITDQNSGRGHQKDFFLTGETRQESNFSKVDSVRDGSATKWYKNGQAESKMTYAKGKQHGKQEAWYENGQQKWVANYDMGKLDGEVKSYHANQKLKRTDIYRQGKLVNGQCFNEEGVPVPHYLFEVMPEFPGGQKAMFRFLANNIQIPKDMQKAKQNGKIILSFVISREGQVEHIKVVKTTHESLAVNAVQMLQAMPRWKPGVQDGESMPVKFTVPFNIKAE